MTWVDLVREYVLDADDELCNFILWERTAFPMASEETVRKQLQEYIDNLAVR